MKVLKHTLTVHIPEHRKNDTTAKTTDLTVLTFCCLLRSIGRVPDYQSRGPE